MSAGLVIAALSLASSLLVASLLAVSLWAVSLPAAGTAAAAPGGAYAWPIGEPRSLSSTFGEFRPGHYHGGIDFSTGQRTGAPLFAVDDGWVWRVRASGVGYGRSLYLRLPDGRTAVYGHLDSFAPAIARFVEAAQESLERYEVDLFPGPGRLAVHRGEEIARSGESGAGPPHFHFEMREGAEAGEGVNPQILGFVLPDTVPPEIRALTIAPFGPWARVSGAVGAAVIAPASAGRGRYRIPGVPVITGSALLSVRAVDPTGGGNRTAPRRATLEVDGVPRFDLVLDRIDWERAQEVELAYDYARTRHGDDFTIHLFRPPGVSKEYPAGGPPLAGLLSGEGPHPLSPGRHGVVVRVADAAGNESRLDFDLEVRPPALAATFPAGRGGPAGAAAATLALEATETGGVVRVTARSSRPLGAADDLVVRTGPGSMRVRWLPQSATQAVAEFLPPEGNYVEIRLEAWATDAAGRAAGAERVLPCLRVTPGEAATLTVGRLTLEAGPDAFFEPALILVRPAVAAGSGAGPRGGPAPPKGLVPVGAAVGLDAEDLVLNRPVRVALAPPPDADLEHAGLFLRRGGAEPEWIGNDAGGGGIGGDTRRLGTFALMKDVTPPVVRVVAPGAGARVTTPRPSLRVAVSDAGSGLTWREIEVVLDGVKQIVVYDPEAGTVTGPSRRPLAPGAHELRVEARDRAGNRTVVTRPFIVAAAARAPRRPTSP